MNHQPSDAPDPDDVLYLDYVGSPYPLLSRLTGVPGLGSLVGRLTDDSNSRRHPRDADYMRQLVEQAHGAEYARRIQTVRGPRDLDNKALGSARAVVLLWRDGSGHGWFPIERRIWANTSREARVLVLNGRRRQFELTAEAWASFLFRRSLGKSLVVEAAVAVALLISSPFLLVWDLARGHR